MRALAINPYGQLGWFLFWWNLEFQFLHGFKLFHLVSDFQNSFCFWCTTLPSAVRKIWAFSSFFLWDLSSWWDFHRFFLWKPFLWVCIVSLSSWWGFCSFFCVRSLFVVGFFKFFLVRSISLGVYFFSFFQVSFSAFFGEISSWWDFHLLSFFMKTISLGVNIFSLFLVRSLFLVSFFLLFLWCPFALVIFLWDILLLSF